MHPATSVGAIGAVEWLPTKLLNLFDVNGDECGMSFCETMAATVDIRWAHDGDIDFGVVVVDLLRSVDAVSGEKDGKG